MNPTDAPQPTEAPPSAVWPTLRSPDARALIEFLVAAFGFVEVAAFEEDGTIQHAQLAWPEGGGVMLGDDRPGTDWDARPGSGATYVVTAHPDAIHDRAVAAGAEIVRGLTDQDYGSRDFVARDRDGNLWSFGTYRGEPLPPG